MQIPLTPIALTALVNVAVAGLFAVIPQLRAKFVSWNADQQTAFFGVGSLVLGVLLMAGSCAGLWDGITCTRGSLTTYFVGVVLSSIGGISSAKAAFVVVRLTDRQGISGQNSGRSSGVPHAERPKMLE